MDKQPDVKVKKRPRFQIKKPTFWKKFLPIIPTLILGIAAIFLNLFPKSQDVIIRFRADKVFFISDFSDNQKFDLIKAIPINCFSVINAEPITVSFKKLYGEKSDSTKVLLREEGTVEFTPEFQRYSEFRVYGIDNGLKIGSLIIGERGIVSIALRDRLLASKLRIEIRDYPTTVHLQLQGNEVKIFTDRYSAFDKGQKVNYPEDSSQKVYKFNPWEVEPISEIIGVNKEIILNIDFPDTILSATQIFETGKHGIPIRKLGFEETDITPYSDDTIIQAVCSELQVADKARNEFVDKTVFCRALDFARFRIGEISLKQEQEQKIDIVLKGYTHKFYVGHTAKSMHNVLPTIFIFIFNSDWAKLAIVLGWLATTSLLLFQVLIGRRRS